MQISPPSGPYEFVSYARALLEHRGNLSNAIQALENTPGSSERVVRVLKAAVTSGTTTGPDWAAMVPYKTIEAGFVGSLKNFGVFDTMLPSMLQLPPNTRIVSIVTAASGSVVDEAKPKPVSQLSLIGNDMPMLKAATTIVVSLELLQSPGAQAFLTRELQKSTAGATDDAFLDAIAAGLTPVPATADPIADISAALATMTITAASRLHLVVPADVCARLAMMTGTDGHFIFPDLAPGGGSINGIVVVPSDAATADAMIVDASQVATAGDGVVLDASRQSSIELSDSPTGAAVTSLWQMNLAGLRCERLFAVKLTGSGAAAIISGVSAWA